MKMYPSHVAQAVKRPYTNNDRIPSKKAVGDIVKKRLSQRKSAVGYGISITTFRNKLRNRYIKPPGGQKIFNYNEERSFVDRLVKLSKFGFSVD